MSISNRPLFSCLSPFNVYRSPCPISVEIAIERRNGVVAGEGGHIGLGKGGVVAHQMLCVADAQAVDILLEGHAIHLVQGAQQISAVGA